MFNLHELSLIYGAVSQYARQIPIQLDRAIIANGQEHALSRNADTLILVTIKNRSGAATRHEYVINMNSLIVDGHSYLEDVYKASELVSKK